MRVVGALSLCALLGCGSSGGNPSNADAADSSGGCAPTTFVADDAFLVELSSSAGPLGVTASIGRHPGESALLLRWQLPDATGSIDLDDAASFASAQTFSVACSSVDIDMFEAGVLPGPVVHARISDRSGSGKNTFQFRVLPSKPIDAELDYAFLVDSFHGLRSTALTTFAGIAWNGSEYSSSAWDDPAPGTLGKWASTAESAYTLEEFIHGSVEMGMACSDPAMIDELSEILVTFEGRFAKVADLRARAPTYAPPLSVVQLDSLNAGPASGDVRVLPQTRPFSCAPTPATCKDNCVCADARRDSFLGKDVNPPCRGDGVGGCNGVELVELFLDEGQFLSVPSRLIHAVAQLPSSDRTPNMLKLVSDYVPLIVNDGAVRYFEPTADTGGYARGDQLKIIADKLATSRPVAPYAVGDTDLWWSMIAAEILAANADDSALVPLDATQADVLRRSVATIAKLMPLERTVFSDTPDLDGDIVGSASYFGGDQPLSSDPAYRFSAYSGEPFPTTSDEAFANDASWDVSHGVRLPKWFRMTYESREGTNLYFPATSDARALANQLPDRIWIRGPDPLRPLFHTFLNGSSGWYEVQGTAGYPPMQYCDETGKAYPGEIRNCLMPAGLQGWGLLGAFSTDLERLEDSMIQVSASTDPSIRAFRDRYYLGDYFAFHDATGAALRPAWGFAVYSTFAYRVKGCGGI